MKPTRTRIQNFRIRHRQQSLGTRPKCPPSPDHRSTWILSQTETQQEQDLWRQSGTNPSTEHRPIGQNCRRITNAIRETQKGPHYGFGHQDRGHLYVHYTQQQRKNQPWNGRFLLVGTTIFQKEGVKAKATGSAKA